MSSQLRRPLPHGTWPGVVSVDQVLSSATSLDEVRTDGEDVYWLEGRPCENGRSTIMLVRGGLNADELPDPVEITPGLDVRTRVLEYGGGAWAVDGGDVVAWDDHSAQLWFAHSAQAADARSCETAWRALTEPSTTLRLGDLHLITDQGLVLAVAEDHAGQGEPVTRLVAIPLEGGAPVTLAEGADFYADPRLCGGRLAWCQWNHPNMPWDHTQVMVADLEVETLTLGEPVEVFSHAKSRDSSSLHPRWAGDDLVFVDDASGYWNWQVARHTPQGWVSTALTTTCRDHEQPMWTLGNQTWDLWPPARPHTIVGQEHHDGIAQLVTLQFDPDHPRAGTGTVIEIPDLASIDAVAVTLSRWYVLASFTNRPAELLWIDPETHQWHTVVSAGAAPDPTTVSMPQSLWVEGPNGAVQSWLYRPHHPEVVAPEGDLPPLLVLTHGGPTGSSSCAWSPRIQYWTSRGFAVVDVNYSGSTGFGREYRNRLKGAWGVAEVNDCRAVVDHLVTTGVVDPRRVAITGGSAGGFTTLASLVTTSTYTAGVSRYGIGDLITLATDTHKFEARYLDGLIGPWPQAREIYVERSPITHVDKLATPMLILQGTDDKVVPPAQAEQMAAAVKAAGQPVAMVMFEGEGHGFRGQEARRTALLAEQAFYCELWGLATPDELPDLTWL